MSSPRSIFLAGAAKRLRTDATDAERRLWSRLRNRSLLGVKFVRQCVVGPYIADFACRSHDLIIELDGGQHGTAAGAEKDRIRSNVLAAHGYRVLRFWNSDVLSNTDGVVEVIVAALQKAPSPGLRYAKADLSPRGEVSASTAAEHPHPVTSGNAS